MVRLSCAASDSATLSVEETASAKDLMRRLGDASAEMHFGVSNLIDRVWKDRPLREQNEIVVHPLKFAGKIEIQGFYTTRLTRVGLQGSPRRRN
jgi:hypothetical protein